MVRFGSVLFCSIELFSRKKTTITKSLIYFQSVHTNCVLCIELYFYIFFHPSLTHLLFFLLMFRWSRRKKYHLAMRIKLMMCITHLNQPCTRTQGKKNQKKNINKKIAHKHTYTQNNWPNKITYITTAPSKITRKNQYH